MFGERDGQPITVISPVVHRPAGRGGIAATRDERIRLLRMLLGQFKSLIMKLEMVRQRRGQRRTETPGYATST